MNFLDTIIRIKFQCQKLRAQVLTASGDETQPQGGKPYNDGEFPLRGRKTAVTPPINCLDHYTLFASPLFHAN